MASLEKAAEVVLKKCMNLKSGESCMIITDETRIKLANAILRQAEKITKDIKLVQIPVGKLNGEEPPGHVADEMKHFDVIIMPTSCSLSWTKAREEASKEGARIASMPGITGEIMARAIDVPYESMRQSINELARRLSMASLLEITSPSGTSLKVCVRNRGWEGLDAGIYDEPGSWGNLPAGEVFAAPVLEGTDGIAVFDASIAGIGKLVKPVKALIKSGVAVRIEGKDDALKLKKMLDSVGSRKAFCIAEIGIGANPKAVISGSVLEDEKVLGTCHLAFGSNIMFGGTIDVPVHIDGIIKKPTIKADGKIIMEDGHIV